MKHQEQSKRASVMQLSVGHVEVSMHTQWKVQASNPYGEHFLGHGKRIEKRSNSSTTLKEQQPSAYFRVPTLKTTLIKRQGKKMIEMTKKKSKS